MALYFTFAIECYREVEAIHIGELLRTLVVEVGERSVQMANVDVFAHGDFWYVFGHPKGLGYSPYGYGEGLNEPTVVAVIIEYLYATIAAEHGIRRALCGYEAQDVFDLYGEPELLCFDTPNLVYDRAAISRQVDACEFGPNYYRNP